MRCLLVILVCFMMGCTPMIAPNPDDIELPLQQEEIINEEKAIVHEVTVTMPRSYYELVFINVQLVLIIEQLQEELKQCLDSIKSI